jgi:Protein of unknown function (DUF3999)
MIYTCLTQLRSLAFVISASLFSTTFLWAADANIAASYAISIPITLEPSDAPLQRLVLPAEALARLQTSRYSDVRIFNAQGQPVPMALTQAAAQTQTTNSLVILPAYPIVGTKDAMNKVGISLRIEEQQGKRIVQIDSIGAKSTTGSKNVLGVLLDARNINAPVVSMVLDADLPAGQPVSFEVQASKDLKNWRSLADTVLYRLVDSTTTKWRRPSESIGCARSYSLDIAQ